MKSYNTPIPLGKLKQFDEILKACGGRYLRNPEEAPDQHGHWRVSYEYDNIEDANEHNRRFDRAINPIVEISKRPRLISRILNTIKNAIR